MEMDMLTGKCSDRSMAYVLKWCGQEVVRWYALTPPTTGGRCDRISPSKGLDAEPSRHEHHGEISFEYFSPSYIEARRVGDRMVNTRRPLLYDYMFVHASEDEIFSPKHTLPPYSFLPRVSSDGWPHFPYFSDREVDILCWVAAPYSNELPVYVSDGGRSLKGDHVRITSGPFTNMEAGVVVQPSGGHKDVMVRILDCLWVSLFEVRAGEYGSIELGTRDKHVYIHLNNDHLSEGLHGALDRCHAPDMAAGGDARLARKVLRGYASLRGETDMTRCKLYSLLPPAYLLLGESDEFDRLHVTMRSTFPVIKAGQSRVLLLVTLYSCTGSNLYQRMVYELVGSWMGEASPKRNKPVSTRRSWDYDRWFGHEGGDE